MPPQRDADDELLQAGGWSRRTGAAILFGVLVLAVGLVIGLVRHSNQASNAPSPTPSVALSQTTSSAAPAPAGNDVLISGHWSRLSVGDGPSHEWSVVVSAELASLSDESFTAIYPISVEGPGIRRVVSVDRAEIAADRGNASLVAPTRLTNLRGHAHVEVWIKLRIACGERRFSPRGVRVSIALDGATEPALFRFVELFGSSVVPRPEPC